MQTRQGITGVMVTVYVVHQLPRYRIWAAAFDVLYVSLEIEILSEAASIQTTQIHISEHCQSPGSKARNVRLIKYRQR